MIGVFLCLAAAVTCYVASRRSRGAGLSAVLAWGYAYGLLRAHFADSGAYFVFDSALAGLYLTVFRRTEASDRRRIKDLQMWAAVLVAWPCLMALIPFQPMLVTLVGLRAATLVIPAMLLGTQLRDEDLSTLSVSMSLLNIAVLIIAVMEYRLGVDRFFPQNDVTSLIFQMNDVAHYTAYRIPATFSQAHVYAGTMASTIPILFGGWVQTGKSRLMRGLAILGLATALLGILLAAARMTFILSTFVIALASLKSGLSLKKRLTWYVMLATVALITVSNERLQRFTSLSDTHYVEARIAGSVNRGFFEILVEYPMGNGLGGGGTSLPYFLEHDVRNPVGMESEYARIMLEESVIGLLLWIAFVIWFLTRPTAFAHTAWRDGRRIAWVGCLLAFGSGLIGIGLFTAVPQNVLLFLMIGWVSVRPASQKQRSSLNLWLAKARWSVPPAQSHDLVKR